MTNEDGMQYNNTGLPWPRLGFGLGLRAPHYGHFLNARPKTVDWLEILTENYLHAHPGYWQMLADLRVDYPLVMHGVALNIGSTDPLDAEYLSVLRRLADHIDTPFVSDHLCFTGIDGIYTHDLLPVPYTEEALAHLIPRIQRVQERLARPLVFENASAYTTFSNSTIAEQEFLAALYRTTGCGILLDLNNVHVTSRNQGLEARAYIDAIPADAIAQYHLAGHRDFGTHLLDSHDAPVADAVWELYRYALASKGPRSTLIEWDNAIPAFAVLEAELSKAREVIA